MSAERRAAPTPAETRTLILWFVLPMLTAAILGIVLPLWGAAVVIGVAAVFAGWWIGQRPGTGTRRG